MCGIAGVWYKNGRKIDPELKVGLKNALAHRGPDYTSEIQFKNGLYLVHTRLSIIDTSSASHQPFQKGECLDALVFNGEIYNYSALRAELEPLEGWKTNGDTEVLYELLRGFGLSKLDELNGMFAFAFYHAEEEVLWLVRDRFGIKPLYVCEFDEGIAFASEVRALIPFTQRQTNKDRLSTLLTWQCEPDRTTLLPEITLMKAGSTLKIQNGRRIEAKVWYPWPISVQSTSNQQENLNFKTHFERAVQLRLVSDVPVGAFLSGGIDSSVVVAAMSKVHQGLVKTFTVGFENDSLDERRFAKKVAETFGTTHQELILQEKQVLDWIPKAVQEMDLPSADAINTWLVSKVTKEAGITVALSGLGGDEWFGGYPSFARWSQLNQTKLKPLLNLAKPFAALFPDEKSRMVLNSDKTASEIVQLSRMVFTPKVLQSMGFEHAHIIKHEVPNSLEGVSLAELYYYTQPLLLRDTDQMSMAHALEVRVPFFDVDVVEFCQALNDAQRYSPKQVLKHYLVDSYKDELPVEVWNRKKQGFVLPMAKWMRGPLKEFTEQGLFESALSDVVSTPYVYHWWKSFLESPKMSKDWSRLWMLSVIGHWLTRNNIQIV